MTSGPSKNDQIDDAQRGRGWALVLALAIAFGVSLVFVALWLIFWQGANPSPDAQKPNTQTPQQKGTGLTIEQLSIIAADDEKTSKEKREKRETPPAKSTPPEQKEGHRGSGKETHGP